MNLSLQLKKFGFGFGVLPYSSMGFNLQTTDDFNSANSISSRLCNVGLRSGDQIRAYSSIEFKNSSSGCFGGIENDDF